MRKTLVLSLGAALAMTAVADAGAQGLRERIRERIAERAARTNADANAAAAPTAATIAYGAAPQQMLDFWPAVRATGAVPRPAPLIVFVHGGGWQHGSRTNATGTWKPVHFPQTGHAFASIDYRLVPSATVEQQADDVAHAVRALIDRADSLGVDRRRIVLMGHSAGAHLVALVGTDERYLKGAGLSFADIAGVIALDGAAYDVPAQMKDGPAAMQKTYAAAFGTDPARQRALSPTVQAGAPNGPAFLLLHVQRADGMRQAEALAAALTRAGTAAERHGFPGTGLRGHGEINRRLGDPAYPATATVDAWLQRVVGR